MADRRGGGGGDGMRQPPFSSAQERVFDGGGSGVPGPAAYGSDFDHGSYMALLGAGVPQPSSWAVEDEAPPAINFGPQFSMANYASPSSYQQLPPSLVSPLAASLHPFPSYLHADPPPQWPPRPMPASSSSSLQTPPSFSILPATRPQHHDHHMQQLLRAAALGVGGAGGGSQLAAAPAAVIEQPAKDGYNWRKYGQKQLKDAESPRSYYKCTRDGCPVKKIVERSFDGCIKEITYKARHNHPRPPEPRRGGGHHAGVGDDVAAQVMVEDETSDEDALHDDDGEGGHDVRGSEGQRVVKKHKIIIQTPSEVDLLDDGYRWRKYGQKVVKGNPRPRSYYKCTADSCNVRKQIERASDDPKCVLTTYTGRHNHNAPGRGGAGAAAVTGGSSINLVPSSTSTISSPSGMVQQSSGTRQLKEET